MTFFISTLKPFSSFIQLIYWLKNIFIGCCTW